MPDYSNKLSRLAQLEPPSDGWAAIAAALDQAVLNEHNSQNRNLSRLKWWAAAAAIALLALWLPRGNGPLTPYSTTEFDSSSGAETRQWISYSQELESQLRELRAATPSYGGQHAAILSELEDRVAAVDWQLELPLSQTEQHELWQRRASLLHDLVAVEASNRLSNQLAGNFDGQPVRTLNRHSATLASYQL